jgi:hypothetical protein
MYGQVVTEYCSTVPGTPGTRSSTSTITKIQQQQTRPICTTTSFVMSYIDCYELYIDCHKAQPTFPLK